MSSYSDGVPFIASCLLDPHGRVLAEQNADEIFYAASTLKLPLVVAALRAVDRGELRLDQVLTSTREFPSSADDAPSFEMEQEEWDEGFAPIGEPVTLLEVMRRTIVVSSNEGSNMLHALLGVAAVTENLNLLGAKSSRMERGYSDGDGLRAGHAIETTARDLATMMHTILRGNVLSSSSRKIIVQLLREQEFPVIGKAAKSFSAEAHEHVDWGSKSGAVTGIEHDVAFFGPSPKNAHVLAACSRAYSETAGQTATTALAALAMQLLLQRGEH